MINFSGETVDISGHEPELISWLKKCASAYSFRLVDVSYKFLPPAEMQEANLNHLDHDYITDIITFNYSSGNRLKADMLICPAFIQETAIANSLPVTEEFDRVLVHGLLHCMGFDDTESNKQAEMRAQEEKCLLLRPKKLKNRTIEKVSRGTS